MTQQLHHLDIALSSDGTEGRVAGYTYGDMVDIWHAANETRSNVVGMWWAPEPMANAFKSSGAELIPVSSGGI